MPKTTTGRAERKARKTARIPTSFIPLELPVDLKKAIRARAESLDLSVNQYLRQLARTDLGLGQAA